MYFIVKRHFSTSSFENSKATRKFPILILDCDLLISKIYFKQVEQLKKIIKII